MTSAGERTRELETSVRSLPQQQQTQHKPAISLTGPFTNSPAHSFKNTLGKSPQSVSGYPGNPTPLASADEERGGTSTMPLSGNDHVPFPAPSERGSMRMRSHGANYVSSIRWATVLDSISELKDHYKKKKEEAAGMLAAADYVPRSSPGPRLLYEPVRATEADIPAFIPARPVVDRLVSRYINAYGVASVVLHSGKLLREVQSRFLIYESFWQEPAATPFTSVGLLFSVICLATQYQQLIEDPVNPDTLMRVHVCRERSVHSLVPGQFTRRDTHVLETMINHCASEVFMCKDADIGLWFLLGMLVQLALSLGYH